MMLGARGTSIIVSSGDGGVAGNTSQQCTNFVPTFPSTCIFVTSVGSTTGIIETASGFSSGGFSNVFTTPGYQIVAVETYLSIIGNLNAGKFNRLGRAFPDVSAQGQNVVEALNGIGRLISGTEASSTAFASIIALINDVLLSNGNGFLGFLNRY